MKNSQQNNVQQNISLLEQKQQSFNELSEGLGRHQDLVKSAEQIFIDSKAEKESRETICADIVKTLDEQILANNQELQQSQNIISSLQAELNCVITQQANASAHRASIRYENYTDTVKVQIEKSSRKWFSGGYKWVWVDQHRHRTEDYNRDTASAQQLLNQANTRLSQTQNALQEAGQKVNDANNSNVVLQQQKAEQEQIMQSINDSFKAAEETLKTAQLEEARIQELMDKTSEEIKAEQFEVEQEQIEAQEILEKKQQVKLDDLSEDKDDSWESIEQTNNELANEIMEFGDAIHSHSISTTGDTFSVVYTS